MTPREKAIGDALATLLDRIADAHTLVGLKAETEPDIGPWTRTYDEIADARRTARTALALPQGEEGGITEAEIEELERRFAAVARYHHEHARGASWEFHARAGTLLGADVPLLLAEVRRLRDALAASKLDGTIYRACPLCGVTTRATAAPKED